MNRFLGLALLIVVLAACTQTPGAIALTASDNGKTINAAPNQIITITLDSNATTGYQWNLVTEPNAQVLKAVSSKYNGPSVGGVGAGGTETWQFQAVGAGRTTLKLSYFRPFDPKQVGGEFALVVVVGPSAYPYP